MNCPECGERSNNELVLEHKDGCWWGSNIAPRHLRVHLLIKRWEWTGEVSHLREAQDALSELVSWASAGDIPAGYWSDPAKAPGGASRARPNAPE